MFSNQTSCWWEHLPERKIQPDQLLVVKEVAQMICFPLVVVWTSGCTSFHTKTLFFHWNETGMRLEWTSALRREKLVQVQRWTSKWVELLKKVVCLSLFCSLLYYQRPPRLCVHLHPCNIYFQSLNHAFLKTFELPRLKLTTVSDDGPHVVVCRPSVMMLALLKMAQRLTSVPKVAYLCWWVGGEPGNPVWCPPSLWRGTCGGWKYSNLLTIMPWIWSWSGSFRF